MDSTKLILTQPVSRPIPLEHLSEAPLYKAVSKWDSSEINSISEEKKKQVAKDFESVLLAKLLDEIKNTIGDWGFDNDGTSEQVQGIFWLYLARDIANKGGFGLWKDIYQFLTGSEQSNTTTEPLNKNV